jgi:hypothetical protein
VRRIDDPFRAFREKYFSNFPVSRSNCSASAGGVPLTVMFGQTLAYSALTISHLPSGSSSVSGDDGVDRAFRLAHAAVDAFVRAR